MNKVILIIILFFQNSSPMEKLIANILIQQKCHGIFPAEIIDLIFKKNAWANEDDKKEKTNKDRLAHISSKDLQLSISNGNGFTQQLLSNNWQSLHIQILRWGPGGSVKFQDQIFKKDHIHFSRRFATNASIVIDMPPHKYADEIENGQLLLDGPNNEKIIALTVTSTERKYLLYLLCYDKNKPCSMHFPLDHEVTALGLGSGILALAQGKNFDLYNIDKLTQIKKIASENAPEKLKKISFITKETFLAMSKTGQLYVGFVKDNKIYFKKQKFPNENPEIQRTLLDYAVDIRCPWHVVFIEQAATTSNPDKVERQLYFADLKKIKDGKISYSYLVASQTQYEHKNLWYNADTIGIHSHSKNSFTEYFTLIKSLILSRKQMIERFSSIIQGN